MVVSPLAVQCHVFGCKVVCTLLIDTVGKIRKRWVSDTLSPTGVEVLRAIKERVDPKNIFGAGNLLPNSDTS